ncbi:acyloxyacyl hydrolase [Labilibaculum sp.]|uniref:acyloxyacyl hydrolase n=1 Tax=Labilibaculum sp. TaxID=2060723 RepID=UPI00356400C5
MKKPFLAFIFFLICTQLIAQEQTSKNRITTSFRYHYGFILPHHTSISYLVNERISAIELNVGIIPSSKKNWAQLYKQPEIGLGFYRGSLGNDEVFGNVNAIFPYISFPILSNKKWAFDTQLGLGLAYTKKHFDAVDNYANIAIGTKFNAFFKLLANARYTLSSHWNIQGGIGFNHISNGATSLPNKGLNMVTSNLGINYRLKNQKIKNRTPKLKKNRLPNNILFVWNHGLKQASENDAHKYYSSSLSGAYSIGINQKQKVGFGIDFFYDCAANRGKWDYSPETGFSDRFSQAVFLSHDLVISNLSIIANIGVYTYYKTEPEKPIYTRIGLRYQFNKHIVGNLSLKTHLGKADFIEWGIGYQITKKKHDK